jgi:hypothetical protein
MNGPFREPTLLADALLRGAPHIGLVLSDVRRQVRSPPSRPAARGGPSDNVQFVQQQRFNWTHYERIKQALHAKVCVIAMLVTAVVMTLLWWKAAHGEHVSHLRWLFGVASGWFVARMFRLSLFVFLAAPRSVSFQNGMLRLSGLGMLKPADVLGWALVRDTAPSTQARRCMRLEILCRWFGRKRRWTMFVSGRGEAERLRHMLEIYLTGHSSERAGEQTPGLRLKQNDESVASAHASHILQAPPGNRLQSRTYKFEGRAFEDVA